MFIILQQCQLASFYLILILSSIIFIIFSVLTYFLARIVKMPGIALHPGLDSRLWQVDTSFPCDLDTVFLSLDSITVEIESGLRLLELVPDSVLSLYLNTIQVIQSKLSTAALVLKDVRHALKQMQASPFPTDYINLSAQYDALKQTASRLQSMKTAIDQLPHDMAPWRLAALYHIRAYGMTMSIRVCRDLEFLRYYNAENNLRQGLFDTDPVPKLVEWASENTSKLPKYQRDLVLLRGEAYRTQDRRGIIGLGYDNSSPSSASASAGRMLNGSSGDHYPKDRVIPFIVHAYEREICAKFVQLHQMKQWIQSALLEMAFSAYRHHLAKTACHLHVRIDTKEEQSCATQALAKFVMDAGDSTLSLLGVPAHFIRHIKQWVPLLLDQEHEDGNIASWIMDNEDLEEFAKTLHQEGNFPEDILVAWEAYFRYVHYSTIWHYAEGIFERQPEEVCLLRATNHYDPKNPPEIKRFFYNYIDIRAS